MAYLSYFLFAALLPADLYAFYYPLGAALGIFLFIPFGFGFLFDNPDPNPVKAIAYALLVVAGTALTCTAVALVCISPLLIAGYLLYRKWYIAEILFSILAIGICLVAAPYLPGFTKIQMGDWPKQADIKTYQHITYDDEGTIRTSSYSKDKNHIYYYESLLPDADVQTFVVSSVSGQNAHDKNHVYYEGKVLPDANPSTYQDLDSTYSKDDRTVWCGGEVLSGADAASFELVPDTTKNGGLRVWAKDKNRTYAGCRRYDDVLSNPGV